jgi:hypothetical protein
MTKERSVEITISLIFFTSLLLYWILGFRYYAGLEYAPIGVKAVFLISMANICLGILYFVYRFIKWLLKAIKKLVDPRS